MDASEIQARCEAGQRLLMETDYLGAERLLAEAESAAWASRDFDALSRLYMPLQEARRQRRQRCGEGVVRLDLLSQGPEDHLSGRHVAENYPHGQLLVAGWQSIAPALELRTLQAQSNLYVETFLAAAFDAKGGRAVAVVAFADARLPAADGMTRQELRGALPAGSLVMRADELPPGAHAGTTQTYARVMALWEALHLPLLREAESRPDPMDRIARYRRVIEADYACELAHQKLSADARLLARVQRSRS